MLHVVIFLLTCLSFIITIYILKNIFQISMELGGSKIPWMVNYDEEPSFAFVHRYEPDVKYPVGTFSAGSDSVIKFNLTSKALIDPYSTYFKVTTSVPNTYLVGEKSPLVRDFNFTSTRTFLCAGANGATPYGAPALGYAAYGCDQQQFPPACMRANQVDGSATGMIREILLTDSMKEIERIRNLDVLHSMLSDINYFDPLSSTRRWAGYGGMNTSQVGTGHARVQPIGSDGLVLKTYDVLPALGVTGGFSPDVLVSLGGQIANGGVKGYGDPSVLFNNPLISQFFGATARWTSIGTPGRAATATDNINGPICGGLQLGTALGGIFDAAGEVGYQIPEIIQITGNNAFGCAFTPSTINMLDITNTSSPYYIPPSSWQSQVSNSVTPETTGGFVPFTTTGNATNNTQYISGYTGGSAMTSPYGAAVTFDGQATTGSDMLQSTVINASLITAGAGKTTALRIGDLCNDTTRQYSEFINGSPQSVNSTFCPTSYEPVYSYDIVQNGITNGNSMFEIMTGMGYLNIGGGAGSYLQAVGAKSNPGIITTHTFLLPLPSAVLGCMVPRDKFKLVPMAGFQSPIIEIRLNPFWLFTSFWSPDNSARAYQIENIEFHYESAEFFDNNIELALNQRLQQGLTLYSQGWYNCLEYGCQGTNVSNNYQINVGFDSLKMLLFCFLDSAYQTNSCYRKQFRLSMALTETRLKIGPDWYPSLPYQGNSGTTQGTDNTYEFYYKILQSFGIQHNPGAYAINPYNMAIGQRRFYYDSQFVQWYNKVAPLFIGKLATGLTTGLMENGTASAPLLGSYGTVVSHPLDMAVLAQLSDNGSQIFTSVQNILAANQFTSSAFPGGNAPQSLEFMFSILAFCGNLQYCFHMENSVVGKAMYAIDLDALNYENAMFSGVSTNQQRPFDLVIKNNNPKGSGGSFNGNSTLYAFGYFDMTVKLQQGTPAESTGHS
jgi:hypothetical protein